jgi:hypothetical protein
MPRFVAALAPMLLLLLAAATLAQAPGPAVPDDAFGGLRLGESIGVHREEYRLYRCAPSRAFADLTFCLRIRFERDRDQAYNVMYSLMHTREGIIVYLDRYQRPAAIDAGQAAQLIDQISRARGETARTRTMPKRPELPDGILAVWGKTELEPLEATRVAAMAEGRVLGAEFLVEFLGDVTRSAQEHLPIYRFGGGAGLVWVASFGQDGRSFVRETAVDASAIGKSR